MNEKSPPVKKRLKKVTTGVTESRMSTRRFGRAENKKASIPITGGNKNAKLSTWGEKRKSGNP